MTQKMLEEFYYYIIKKPFSSRPLNNQELPLILKQERNKFMFGFRLKDPNEAEGPFYSLYDLQKKSLIFNSIKLQKHRDRIIKNKNIKEIKDRIITEQGFEYTKDYSDIFDHTLMGKIEKHKVKGTHFYDPEFTRILEVISTNPTTGVYSARIAILNQNTNEWIEKESLTTMFPDNWSINQLFHECYHAYSTMHQINERIYKSTSISGINIIFIKNASGKIVTCYPEL